MAKEVSPRNYEPVAKTDKILALQDELLDLRKDMSRKQATWEKERSNLLSKNEITTIENIELKQRILNLSKINDTLVNALSNQNEIPNSNTSRNKKLKITFGSEENYDNEGDVSSRRNREMGEVKRLTKIVEEKDFQIRNINKIGNELRAKLEERNSIVSSLEESVFILKGKVEKKDEEILKLHRIVQELEEKLEENDQFMDETRRQTNARPSNKILNIEELSEPIEHSRKYIKNSSYLIMRPTPNQSSYESDGNDSYIHQIDMLDQDEEEEEEKLLCEVCSGVFVFGDFEEHVKFCGFKAKDNTRLLIERKKDIESRLEKIRLQEEKENRQSSYRYEGKSDYNGQINRIKDINEIREIVNGYPANRSKKSSYNDFMDKGRKFY